MAYLSTGTVKAGVCAVLITFLPACAPDIYRMPTSFTPSDSGASETIVVNDRTEVRFSSGYSSVLKAGSVWKKVGVIPQGTVYRVENDVFMVEGGHRHEAFSVFNADKLVGFYLPVERAFNPVSPALPVSVKQVAK